MHVEVKDLIAEGDKMPARIGMSGTHDGEFVGLQPTGHKWNYEHIHVFRVAEGKSWSTGRYAMTSKP
jgi:predicted ester cyclase